MKAEIEITAVGFTSLPAPLGVGGQGYGYPGETGVHPHLSLLQRDPICGTNP